MTVGEALAAARALGVDRLDAQLLVGRALGRPRTWLLAHDEAVLPASEAAALQATLRQRAAGRPLAYLLGEREFHGLLLEVTPDVLIPRPDTETLVDWAIARLGAAALPAPEVLDLGTGSGAIALAVKHAWPAARVTALDRSAAALSVARRSGTRLGLDVEWLQSDWWAVLGARRFDLLLANPPYIAEGDPHLAALADEPQGALTAGADGLDALRVLARGAAPHLRPGGWLLLEHGHEQARAVRALLAGAGFGEIETRQDLAGRPRCSGGRR